MVIVLRLAPSGLSSGSRFRIESVNDGDENHAVHRDDGLAFGSPNLSRNILFVHDFVPLGKLNDTEASAGPSRSLSVLITGLSGLSYLLLLDATWRNFQMQPLPRALLLWLWIGYGLLFAGELNAWWIAFFVPTGKGQLAIKPCSDQHFLRERNGIQPNISMSAFT